MQNYQRFWRSVVAVMVVVVGLMVAAMPPVAQADSRNPNPGVFPLNSNPHGNSYSEWSARWWQWALSIPAATNPVLDETGANCAQGQSGQVWFLASSFSGIPPLPPIVSALSLPEKSCSFRLSKQPSGPRCSTVSPQIPECPAMSLPYASLLRHRWIPSRSKPASMGSH